MFKKIVFSFVFSLCFVGGMTACNDNGGDTPTGTPGPSKTVAPTLSYSVSSAVFSQAVAITPLQPTVTGTAPTFSVSPSLPAGLSLGANGVISGTPTVGAVVTTYTVTATNAGGSASFQLSLRVKYAAPTNLSYAGSPYTFPATVAITPLVPSVTGTVFSWAVSPALPSGLSLNTTTGTISGAPAVDPTNDFPSGTFQVTASNDGGSVSTTISISSTPQPQLGHVHAYSAFLVLELSMGPYAGRRTYGDTTDGDEAFVVRHKAGDGCNVLTVEAFGASQKFVASYLFGNGGAGNNSIKIIDEDGHMCAMPVYFIAGTGSGTSSVMSYNGAKNVLEGTPRDTLVGGSGDDVFIVDVPVGYSGVQTGTITPGAGHDALLVRPSSGNAYVDLAYSSLATFVYTGFAQPDLTGQQAQMHFLVPSGVDLAVAAFDGTQNHIVAESSLPVPVTLIGGNSSNDKLQVTGVGGRNVVWAFSTNFTQIVNPVSNQCTNSGTPLSSCSRNTYYLPSDTTEYAIDVKSVYDITNSAGMYLNSLSACAAHLARGGTSYPLDCFP